MATSSIFQNVLVKDRRGIQNLIGALEHSRATPAKDVVYSRPVEVVEDLETIKKIFGVRTDDGVQDSHA